MSSGTERADLPPVDAVAFDNLLIGGIADEREALSQLGKNTPNHLGIDILSSNALYGAKTSTARQERRA